MGNIDAGTLYGSLSLLILQALTHGPVHGLGISRRIEQLAGDALRIEEGALYPALHRLERDGLLTGAWGISDTQRRAKLYELTEDGHRRLRRETRRWLRHTNAVAAVLDVSRQWSD